MDGRDRGRSDLYSVQSKGIKGPPPRPPPSRSWSHTGRFCFFPAVDLSDSFHFHKFVSLCLLFLGYKTTGSCYLRGPERTLVFHRHHMTHSHCLNCNRRGDCIRMEQSCVCPVTEPIGMWSYIGLQVNLLHYLHSLGTARIWGDHCDLYKST